MTHPRFPEVRRYTPVDLETACRLAAFDGAVENYLQQFPATKVFWRRPKIHVWKRS